MITYAQFLYGTEYDARILACVNGLVYLLYIMILMPHLLKNEIHQWKRQKEQIALFSKLRYYYVETDIKHS